MDIVADRPAAMAFEPGLQADQRLIDRAWLRIGAGLAVAAQAMVFSLAVNITPADGAGYWVVHGGLIASALGVMVFLGGDLMRAAWEAVRAGRVSIDLLFLVTLTGAFVGSLISSFTQTGSVYYEVVAVLIVVHTAGRMLGARSRVAALRAADTTRARFDRCEVVLASGDTDVRASSAVTPVDRVRVAPGAAICVDGTVIAGRSYVQETSMTGEWRPVARGPGDRVLAGTYSVDGSLEIRPDAGPRRLDAILAALERARLAPSDLQRQADRLMTWFLPLVVSVSAATLAYWWMRAPWSEALFNAMAVLLVACPCAMGLATPVAVWGGLARLTTFGVVARTGDFLSSLARCDTVCFDKTGTLSDDTLILSSWNTEPAWRGREAWLIAAAGLAERNLSSPIARAFEAHAVAGGDRGLTLVSQKIEPGLGVVAVVREESGAEREVRVGERSLHARPETLPVGEGKRVFVSIDGGHVATVELGERWREGLREAFTELAALGVRVEVLTGDPHPPADLGVPVRRGLTPEEKQGRVAELGAGGETVLFVGDGVNDVAAMSSAAATVALRGGSDLSCAAAMAVFAGADLRFLPRAVRLARAVVGGIRGNLIFASTYNLTGMALAAAGLLHPVVAALLMVGSSALVALRALRSARAVGSGV